MKHISIILYTMIVATLAGATLLGRVYGTTFVENEVYHAVWFFLLWLFASIAAIFMLIKVKIWKMPYTALLHLSFLVILAGAATTYFTGTKGHMHILPEKAARYFIDTEGGERQLPFTMQLDSFVVKYYSGTNVPADYVSYIKIDGVPHTISMNKILKKEGYRFYQSSYDKEGGSMLSVSHDPYGNATTYTGYILFAVASGLLLLAKRENFRKLLKHPSLRRGTTFALLVLLGCTSMQAKELPSADSLARKQILYKGRVAPFDTQARDFLKKLSGRESYKGLSAVEVVTSWQREPQKWYEEPIIKIKDRTLREKLGIGEEFASLSQLYNGNREYKLQKILEETRADGNQQSTQKAIFATDEKAGMILMLLNGTLIKELPSDGSVEPLSRAAVETEIIYNRLPVTKILFMTNLTLGAVAFFLLLAAMTRGTNGTIKRCWKALRIFLYASCTLLAANYLTRWYIGGRVPLSNGYETMIFMALSILIISCLIERRFSFALAAGFLLSGFTLLVAHLGEMNPQITPLMPVLVSPLLSIHVSLIMIAYALFAFIMMGGIVALVTMRRKNEKAQESVEAITTLSRLLLYPATLFLGVGIFIGAVWANVSWGRYWAWDPKEVWALITFMIYGAAFHTKSIEKFRDKRFFHIYMIAAFAAVIITYFGVNYLLGGMHSYANA